MVRCVRKDGEMTDKTSNPAKISGSKVTRRQALKFGGAAMAASAADPSLLTSRGIAAQATPEVAPEVAAFYTPESGAFDGQELHVVINASFVSTEPRREMMDSLRAEFNGLTGASVSYLPLPENQMYDQVRLELANETGAYDMMHTGAGGAKDFGLSGFLIPLPTPPDIDDFYEGDVAQYTIGDELYGLPMIADINLIYWRTDLFEQVGLDPEQPPETYDQFREYAIRLTTDTGGRHADEAGFDANSIDVFGSAYKGTAGLACTWEWYNYLYAFGGQLMDADYNPLLDSAEAVASLGWVVENFREHGIYPPDITTYDYTEFHTLFLQGRMAMAINWPYMWAMAQDPEQSQVVDQVRVGLKPAQVTHGGNIGGWSWNVFQMSRNQDLAVAFAKWMSSPEASLRYARVGTGNPVRTSVSALMVEQDPVLYDAIGQNLRSGRSVEWLNTGASWLEIERVQYEAIQLALIGESAPEAALAGANQQVLEILERNRFYEDLAPQLKGEA